MLNSLDEMDGDILPTLMFIAANILKDQTHNHSRVCVAVGHDSVGSGYSFICSGAN